MTRFFSASSACRAAIFFARSEFPSEASPPLLPPLLRMLDVEEVMVLFFFLSFTLDPLSVFLSRLDFRSFSSLLDLPSFKETVAAAATSCGTAFDGGVVVGVVDCVILVVGDSDCSGMAPEDDDEETIVDADPPPVAK